MLPSFNESGPSLVHNQEDPSPITGFRVISETIGMSVYINITLEDIRMFELLGLLEGILKSYSLSEKDMKIVLLSTFMLRPNTKLERDGSRTLHFSQAVHWSYSSPQQPFYQNVILGRRRFHGAFDRGDSTFSGIVTVSGSYFAVPLQSKALDGIAELALHDYSTLLKKMSMSVSTGINPGLIFPSDPKVPGVVKIPLPIVPSAPPLPKPQKKQVLTEEVSDYEPLSGQDTGFFPGL